MIPFLHLGPLTIPTFGLMVACAMLAAFFVLRADLMRRGLSASVEKRQPSKTEVPGAQPKTDGKNAGNTDEGSSRDFSSDDAQQEQSRSRLRSGSAEAEMLIAIPCLAGIAGAKLYHVLESPADFFAHPIEMLFSPFGFAWFGGLLAGFAAFVWVGRRQHIPLLTLLDAGSPAAALGYGVGRIGCFLSGDGDYGIPTSLPWGMSFPNGLVPTTERVHPTPIYELIAACAIAWWLWRIYDRQLATLRMQALPATKKRVPSPEWIELSKMNKRPSTIAAWLLSVWVRALNSWHFPPAGDVFAAYLVLTGLARFLVEFIRINPRSFLGMSNAQAASLASMIAGVAFWWWLTRNPHRLTRSSR
jgi:phosphatidylglycerol---prolipoprotein diacylglyceryl transferase